MQFNSVEFLFFFPVVLSIYFVIPRKMREVWLLISSYFFYMCWNAVYALLILFSTLVTYSFALLIRKRQRESQSSIAAVSIRSNAEMLLLIFGIGLNLAVLFFFKYYDFFFDSLESLLAHVGITFSARRFDVLLPVGISFYTFQALGYLIDVYRQKVDAERDFIKYALFVSFFPQLVAGPIERSGRLLSQIRNTEKINVWNYERIVSGFVTMLWGYFLKVMIADRAAEVVNYLFGNYTMYGFSFLALGTVFFAVQIYCDFAGYSTIAIGAAKIMGFELMENFNAPYFASSVRDFWRRWHISLSTWFKDYLYIPLGGNRKGAFRKYVNTFIVFLVSGLWHGANMTFVIWGMLHGLYQIIGGITQKPKEKIYGKLGVAYRSTPFTVLKVGVTFALTCFAWIFFRAPSLPDAFNYIRQMFTVSDLWMLTGGTIYNIGLPQLEMNILFLSVAALLIVDLLKYKKVIRAGQTAASHPWVRLFIIFILIAVIAVFGRYGYGYDAQQFIYFEF